MAVSEAARHDLYNALTGAIGPGPTETLMSAVSLHDLDEVATKGDLTVAVAELKVEIAELRAEMKSDIAAPRKSFTTWMLTLLVAIVGAMVSIGFVAGA